MKNSTALSPFINDSFFSFNPEYFSDCPTDHPFYTSSWEQRKLSEMCGTFEYGLNAAAKEFDGKNKYIRITDIDDVSREFLLSDLSSPDICLDGMSKYLLSSGDVVFARTGASVGKTYIYRENDGIVYFAGFLIRAKVNQDNDAEFVFQSTLSPSYEKYIRITSQRSGQPGVNAQEYSEYDLFAPSKEEQQRIGHFLRGIDHLITLHQRKGKAAVSGCFLNCSSLEKSSAQSRTLELFGQTSNQEIKYIIDGLSILGGKLRNFCVKLIILLSYTRINDIAKYHISRNTECVHNIN